MKSEDVARPGLLALGIVGVAATAQLGFGAGVAVARDPEALRRTARGLARGLERATLMAAQAREHVGDLWAEAREEAVAEVDAADFERAAAKASQAVPVSAAAAAPLKAARKRSPGPLMGHAQRFCRLTGHSMPGVPGVCGMEGVGRRPESLCGRPNPADLGCVAPRWPLR